MFQVRIHGRGGQGVVSAAEILSVAAFYEGKFAQAFPSFGSERMGAPVISFCRYDEKEIRAREPISHPDAIIIQDPTLLHSVDVFGGMSEDGYILLNTEKSYEELGIADFVKRFPKGHVRHVAATRLALKHINRPLPNAALLGGFAAVAKNLHLDSVKKAVLEKFPGKVGEQNIAAIEEAYETTV